MGVYNKKLGDPLGEKVRFTGHGQFKTSLLGAIHIRRDDDGEDLDVTLRQGHLEPITIYRR